MFKKFKKALLHDKESFDLSKNDDEQIISSTFKIPQDLDIEKRSTTIIERLASGSDL